LLCERWLQHSAPDPTAERVLDGTDETFTIRLAVARVNTEHATSFLGHHISATFELRAGVVKAEARRVERSESLGDVEQSSTLIM
jgi:hypothetical protein